MVTKKRPISTSRKGLMSSSTWNLYSVSEISMPATKAPSASERPASSVMVARLSVMSSTLRMNTSDDLARATKWNHLRIRRWPKTRITASTTTALSKAIPSSTASFSGGWVSDGMMTSSGTTARSWNNRTPMISRPWGESSCMRSASSLVMTAVDDMAKTPPSAIPNCQLTPISMIRPAASTMVTTTCSRPSPKTMRFIENSLGRENSRPMENIRKTTPNSASDSARWMSSIRFSACGPMTLPTNR